MLDKLSNLKRKNIFRIVLNLKNFKREKIAFKNTARQMAVRIFRRRQIWAEEETNIKRGEWEKTNNSQAFGSRECWSQPFVLEETLRIEKCYYISAMGLTYEFMHPSSSCTRGPACPMMLTNFVIHISFLERL